MASFDWSQCPAVESIPGKVSGAWVFRDSRLPVSIVFENLEAGATIDEITEWFHVTREQIVTVLEFAARSLRSISDSAACHDIGRKCASSLITAPRPASLCPQRTLSRGGD